MQIISYVTHLFFLNPKLHIFKLLKIAYKWTISLLKIHSVKNSLEFFTVSWPPRNCPPPLAPLLLAPSLALPCYFVWRDGDARGIL